MMRYSKIYGVPHSKNHISTQTNWTNSLIICRVT
jgi:hypothetical protein